MRALFPVAVHPAHALDVPTGQWPDGTGGSPVPPFVTSEFGFSGMEAADWRVPDPAGRMNPGANPMRSLRGAARGDLNPNSEMKAVAAMRDPLERGL